jgi:hypothetical protein
MHARVRRRHALLSLSCPKKGAPARSTSRQPAEDDRTKDRDLLRRTSQFVGLVSAASIGIGIGDVDHPDLDDAPGTGRVTHVRGTSHQ